MPAPFFTGYLAQGVGSGSGFVENAATGYARYAVTLGPLNNSGLTSLTGPVMAQNGATAVTVTQRALYDAPTGGNLIMWWNVASPIQVAANGIDFIRAGSLNHTFPALALNGQGITAIDTPNGTKIGTTADGSAILAGVTVEARNGVMYAAIVAGGSSLTAVTTVAASGASQALAFASSGNAASDITLTANCAITLTGGTSGQYQSVVLILRQGGSGGFTPTLPAAVRWPGGVAPTPNTVAGKIDVFTFSTSDAGLTVFGSY
jgi:hypothetical protein